jgi:hypothetical protein
VRPIGVSGPVGTSWMYFPADSYRRAGLVSKSGQSRWERRGRTHYLVDGKDGILVILRIEPHVQHGRLGPQGRVPLDDVVNLRLGLEVGDVEAPARELEAVGQAAPDEVLEARGLLGGLDDVAALGEFDLHRLDRPDLGERLPEVGDGEDVRGALEVLL